MLSKHVESEVLQLLEVEDHGFIVWRKVDSIRPESLVQSAKSTRISICVLSTALERGYLLEKKFAIDQWPLNAVNLSDGNGSEPCVRSDFVGSHSDGKVITILASASFDVLVRRSTPVRTA